ncbi:CHAT domain-containing protein [Actinoplanes sp. NPDC049548]|uniref:CHAT domain-containing protein n=1 Tax=Actinoplanes sp. NPDC049548 TaxID=3155152 RepID=UPI00342E743F
MNGGERHRRWSTDAVAAAAQLLFRGTELSSFTPGQFEAAAGPALRLASLAAAATLDTGAVPTDPVPPALLAKLSEFSAQTLLVSLFDLGQALDLWSLLWRGRELNSQLWRDSDLPQHTIAALRRRLEERRPLAWWTTAHDWVTLQRAELDRRVQRAKEIDRALASTLLDRALADLDAALTAGEPAATGLDGLDFEAQVRSYARQNNIDSSGKRVHHMPAALQAVAAQAATIAPHAPWAVPPPDGLADIAALLSELAEHRPSLADAFQILAEPVSAEDRQEELDGLALSLLETLDDEQVRIAAARELHALGARGALIDQALTILAEFEQRISDLEAAASSLPTQAQDLLALARAALDEYDLQFGSECLAGYHRVMDWTAFREDLAALEADSGELPEAERDRTRRILRAAEITWSDWNAPPQRAEDARKLLADLRGTPAQPPPPADAGRQPTARRPASTPVSEAKRLFETQGAEAAVAVAWPDRSRCPDAPTRYFLFRVFRAQVQTGPAEQLLMLAEAAGLARAFDYLAYCQVLIAAGDHARARSVFDKAELLGADESALRSVRRALAPAPAPAQLPILTGSPAAEVLAWVDRLGAANISEDIARTIVDTQREENGLAAAAEVALRLGAAVPGIAGRFFTRLTRPQIAALAPRVRTEFAELLARDSIQVVDRCATLFLEAKCAADAATLLRAATATHYKRDLLRVQRLLLQVVSAGDPQEAERLLAEQIFPRPGADVAARTPVFDPQPASQPYGEANISLTKHVQKAREAIDAGDPAAADLWLAAVREGRRIEALATTLHYLIVAGRAADALRLVASPRDVPVSALPWVGVQWNIACAYAALGHNDTAAALFAKHAEWMDRPYLASDARAVAQLFRATGRPLPAEYSRALAAAESTPGRPQGQRTAQPAVTGLRGLQDRFRHILFTSRRKEPAPTVERIPEYPEMAGVREAADTLLDRYYLLVPARIERSWDGELEAEAEAAVNRAAALLAEDDAAGAAAELTKAWEQQPTHEGIMSDLVGLLAGQRRCAEARSVADAGGERALRHDLLCAVAAAEDAPERSLECLITAQRMEASEVRTFAVAALALRLGKRADAVRALAEEALRHVPGQLRITGGLAVMLAAEDADQQTVDAVLTHCRTWPGPDELVECVVRNDVPFDLVTLPRSLTREHLDRLADGFLHRPAQWNVALHQRLQRLSPDRRAERRDTYEFLVTRALEDGMLRQAAQYLCRYEKEYGPEVTAALRETAEGKYPPFRRILLDAKAGSQRLSAEERAEFDALREGSKALVPRTAVREFEAAVKAVAAMPVDVLVDGTAPELEAVFAGLRAVIPPSAHSSTADDLTSLWRSQLADAGAILRQGRALSHAEFAEARQRRAQILRLCTSVDPRLQAVLRDLSRALYEPWKEINRPRRAVSVTSFRPSGAADPALFAGRQRHFDLLKSGFAKLPDRGGWEIHHIHGPSGMGKSSLAKALAPREDAGELLIPGVVPLWINSQSLADAVERHKQPLFRALAALVVDRHQAIRTMCPQLALPDVGVPGDGETGRDFVRWVDRSLPQGTAWLLLLDEFDHLARLPDGRELVSELRQARDEEGHAFGAVLLSRYAPLRLDQMLGGVQLETLDVTLDCLDAAATRTVLDRGMPTGLTLTAEAHQLAYEVTRGFPLHIQHLGKTLVTHAGGEPGALDGPAVTAAVTRYRNDSELVERELLPRTIRGQDYRRSMGPTLELLGRELPTDRLFPEAHVFAGLDSARRQEARDHLRQLSEAGLLVRDGDLLGWLNPIIADWAVKRTRATSVSALTGGTGLGAQLREKGFELLKQDREKQVLRRGAQTYDAVPVPAEHAPEVTSLLSAAFRGLPQPQRAQFEGFYDQHVVLLRPQRDTSLSYRVRAEPVEIDQAVEWIIDAASTLVSVDREAGLAHGWLSLARLVDVGGRVWVTGWGESAVAQALGRWPAKWEKGHVRREPEGTANGQDDGFALAVMLAQLLSYSPSAPETQTGDPPCQTGADGIADPRYLNLPRLNVVDDPDGRYRRLLELLEDLLRSPASPRQVRNALLEWAGRAPMPQTTAVHSQIELRLRATGNADWRAAPFPLEVTAGYADGREVTYETVLAPHAWDLFSRFVQDVPAMQSGDELAKLGALLREALFGMDVRLDDPLFTRQDPAGPVTRVVIVGDAAVHRVPWEMAAVGPNKALADVASVVRRLDAHVTEPGELQPIAQHLVLGRPGATMPTGVDADQVSYGWEQFRRHQGRESVFHFLGEGTPGTLSCGTDECDLVLLGDVLFSRNTALALLTACNSNAPDAAGASTALHLARGGLPAVVAMNGKVQTDTADEFAATLLERLHETGDIELAVHDARRRMVHGYVWNGGLPVLFLSTADGRLFRSSSATR